MPDLESLAWLRVRGEKIFHRGGGRHSAGIGRGAAPGRGRALGSRARESRDRVKAGIFVPYLRSLAGSDVGRPRCWAIE